MTNVRLTDRVYVKPYLFINLSQPQFIVHKVTAFSVIVKMEIWIYVKFILSECFDNALIVPTPMNVDKWKKCTLGIFSPPRSTYLCR